MTKDEASARLQELVERDRDHDCPGFGKDSICVRIVAIADLPSRFGQFQIVAFWNNRDAKEHVAVIKGEILEAEDVPVRLHSECLTGDALGSLRCDCRDQLEAGCTQLGVPFIAVMDPVLQALGRYLGAGLWHRLIDPGRWREIMAAWFR